MRLGIVIKYLDNLAPATASFEQSILRSLSKLNKNNEIFIFTHSDVNSAKVTKDYPFGFVNIDEYDFKINTLV